MSKLQDKLTASVRKARAGSTAPVPPAEPAGTHRQPAAPAATAAPAAAQPAARPPAAPRFAFPDRVWPD